MRAGVQPGGEQDPRCRRGRTTPVRILIADDHGLLRAGLRALLKDEPGMEVVGEAADGDEALALAGQLNPDVILADISMPGPSGIEVAKTLRTQAPAIHVLIMTMHEDRGFVRDALEAGAAGYLIKRAAETELVRAISTVAGGETYIYRDLQEPAPDAAGKEPSPSTASPLTDVETAVLRGIARGLTNQQMAREMNTTTSAVADLRTALSEKLGLHSRVELMSYARRRGLV